MPKIGLHNAQLGNLYGLFDICIFMFKKKRHPWKFDHKYYKYQFELLIH